MVDSLLSARGLNKRFLSGDEPVPVLVDLSLHLEAGESLALTGRSGSGKSTLLNILCGLEKPDAGMVRVLGETFDTRSTEAEGKTEKRWGDLRRQRIGVVFQEANLMPALSLLDNVRFRARLAGQPEGDCQDWLERLGIGKLAGRFPDQVSGGQRQRAALAMVFAMKPALILADEPTGSLDRHTAEAVIGQLFELQARYGCGLILATHDPELATRCSQRLDLAHLVET